MYIVAAVPVTLLDVLWDDIKPHIDRVVALAEDEISTQSMYERAKNGEILVIIICRDTDIVAALTLEVRTFDTGVKALYVPVVGGNEMESWLDQFLNVAKAIAKDFGCTQLRGIAVRKGWLRILQSKGWDEVCTIIKADLE
jgi:hypothetical protein